MQRVRAGLTGLAAIFLVVLVAAAGLKPARPVAATVAQGETLSVLGVAPGSGEAERRPVVVRSAVPAKAANKPPVT